MERSLSDVRHEQLVGLMTRSLPGILRLNGEDSQADDVSVSSRPDRARPTGSIDNGNEVRPKVKKKVTFKAEEHLEIVMEISPRLDSPLVEELEPCDPEKLMIQDGVGGGQALSADLYGTGGGYQNSVNSGCSGKKPSDVVTKIGGIMGFGLPMPIAPPVLTMRKGRPGLPDRRTIIQERQLQTNNTHKRIRSAPPLKAPPTGKDGFLGYESPMEQRFTRHGAAGSLGSKSGSYRSLGSTSHVYRGGQGRPKSPVEKRELLTANLNVTRSRGSQQVRGRNDPLHAKSRYHHHHQVHQSPYRQGSGSLGSRRSITKSDTPSLSVTGSRMDAHNKTERRVMSAPAVSPRKIHAWQEANMALRSNGLLVSEPCIAQLWDTPQHNVETDAQYGTKCS